MESLPVEIVEKIVQQLTPQDLARCSAVCREWRDIINQDRIWKLHCDPDLEEPLQTIPCATSPAFMTPESENSTLPPNCHWKLAFMRENHLWKNWRRKGIVNERESWRIRNSPRNVEFLTDTLIVAQYSNHIEIFDVSAMPPAFVARTDIRAESFSVIGHNMVLVERNCLIKVFYVDILNRSIKFMHNILDSPVCPCVVKEHFYLYAINKESKLVVFDLNTGKTLKEEPFPVMMNQNESVEVWRLITSPTSDFVAVAFEVVNNNANRYRKYYIYSLEQLAFLPGPVANQEIPVAARLAPVAARLDPFAVRLDRLGARLAARLDRLRARLAPVAPIPAPEAPIPAPVAPILAPVAPGLDPLVARLDLRGARPAPEAPIPAPVAAIPAPVAPRPAPAAHIPAPVAPIPAPVAPIPAPEALIPAPVVPIPAPEPPIPAPEAPRLDPLVARLDLRGAKPAPEAPIPAPVVPIPAPEAPRLDPLVARLDLRGARLAPEAPILAPEAPIPAPAAPIPAPPAPIPAPVAPIPAPVAPRRAPGAHRLARLFARLAPPAPIPAPVAPRPAPVAPRPAPVAPRLSRQHCSEAVLHGHWLAIIEDVETLAFYNLLTQEVCHLDLECYSISECNNGFILLAHEEGRKWLKGYSPEHDTLTTICEMSHSIFEVMNNKIIATFDGPMKVSESVWKSSGKMAKLCYFSLCSGSKINPSFTKVLHRPTGYLDHRDCTWDDAALDTMNASWSVICLW